jgi:hypothetical protein
MLREKRTHLPALAGQVPEESKRESRVKRFSRWITNDHIEVETYFLPFAEALLASLAQHTLVLVLDGSVGHGYCLP